MADQLTCGGNPPCQFWIASPGAYVGDCGMQVVYHRPAFNYAPPDGPCRYHSELGKAPVEVSQQSACRGDTFEAWRRRLMGK